MNITDYLKDELNDLGNLFWKFKDDVDEHTYKTILSNVSNARLRLQSKDPLIFFLSTISFKRIYNNKNIPSEIQEKCKAIADYLENLEKPHLIYMPEDHVTD